MQQVKRVTLSGAATAITFDHLCGKYLVKNFSDEVVYVSFEPTVAEENSIKIPANFYQVAIINDYYADKTKTIYANGTGEIEVQQLCFM